jgi:hypothetical protein
MVYYEINKVSIIIIIIIITIIIIIIIIIFKINQQYNDASTKLYNS